MFTVYVINIRCLSYLAYLLFTICPQLFSRMMYANIGLEYGRALLAKRLRMINARVDMGCTNCSVLCRILENGSFKVLVLAQFNLFDLFVVVFFIYLSERCAEMCDIWLGAFFLRFMIDGSNLAGVAIDDGD